MELRDTVELMESEKYEDRFLAEYVQLKIRSEKLRKMLHDWDEGKLNFVPKSDRHTLMAQLWVMTTYISVLKMRAEEEEIDLSPYEPLAKVPIKDLFTTPQ